MLTRQQDIEQNSCAECRVGKRMYDERAGRGEGPHDCTDGLFWIAASRGVCDPLTHLEERWHLLPNKTHGGPPTSTGVGLETR